MLPLTHVRLKGWITPAAFWGTRPSVVNALPRVPCLEDTGDTGGNTGVFRAHRCPRQHASIQAVGLPREKKQLLLLMSTERNTGPERLRVKRTTS